MSSIHFRDYIVKGRPVFNSVYKYFFHDIEFFINFIA